MFKDKLYELMTEKGIYTQRQLSNMTGIPTTTISGWINAGRLPDYTAIKKLSQFFEISSDELLEQNQYTEPQITSNSNFYNVLGRKLQELRLARGISLVQMSEEIQISKETLHDWEQGNLYMSYSDLVNVANYFNVALDFLLFIQGEAIDARNAAIANQRNIVGAMGQSLTVQERELLELFRGLSPYLQGMPMEAVKSWAKKNNNGEQKKA